MRKEQLAYISLALLLILAVSVFAAPVRAFVNPDGPNPTTNSNYELYGPHLDELIVKEYTNPVAEWTALSSRDIDITDWPLTPTYIASFGADSKVNVLSAGGMNSMYVIDFNLDDKEYVPNSARAPYKNLAWNGPVTGDSAYPSGIPPITNNTYFRIACRDLFNYSYYSDFLGEGGQVILTPLPAYMGLESTDWIWPATTPTFSEAQALIDLYRGHIYNYTTISGVNVTEDWYWDYRGIGPHVPTVTEKDACLLEFSVRQDANRAKAGELLYTELTNLGFSFTRNYGYESVSGDTNYGIVMIDKNYLITTLGWGSVGPTPDYLYAGYNSANFWDDPTSSCPDESCAHDPIMDNESWWVHNAPTQAVALEACIAFQQRYFAIADEVCLYSPTAIFASSINYVGPNHYGPAANETGVNQTWIGFANTPAVGTQNWFTILNAYANGNLYGTGPAPAGKPEVLRWGWSVQGYPLHLNPLYSEWVWDYDILGEMFDTPGYLDPYNLQTWHPDLILNWTVGTWTDATAPPGQQTKSMVTLTLRPDLYWSDGVPITMADVMFSIVQIGSLCLSKGLPPPWWWPTAATMQSVAIHDQYTVSLLFNLNSIWAEGWGLAGFYIVPEHIWKPIILLGTHGPATTWGPDPNQIASGPFRYYTSDGVTTLVMIANRPGSTVTTNLVGAVPTTSPEGYHNYSPVHIEVNTLEGSWPDYAGRIPIDLPTDTVSVPIRLTLVNRLSNSSGSFTTLDVNKTVTVACYNGTVKTLESNVNVDLLPGVPVIETWPDVDLGIGNHTVTVTVVINSPDTVPDGPSSTEANPWKGQVITTTMVIYVTNTVDIGGSNFYDDIGWGNQTQLNEAGIPYKSELPTPDFVVDGTDIAVAASAFGSYPGSSRWSPVADVNNDFVIDGSDIAIIATRFGW
jgi:hypothetical protein